MADSTPSTAENALTIQYHTQVEYRVHTDDDCDGNYGCLRASARVTVLLRVRVRAGLGVRGGTRTAVVDEHGSAAVSVCWCRSVEEVFQLVRGHRVINGRIRAVLG